MLQHCYSKEDLFKAEAVNEMDAEGGGENLVIINSRFTLNEPQCMCVYGGASTGTGRLGDRP